jgi:RNA-directed DNA polymerase
VGRYWGKLNPVRDDHWVFGDKHPGHYLLKFSWFKIERHPLVQRTASPDNPSLREYWWARRKVNSLHLTVEEVELAIRQDWICPICRMELVNGESLERHHRIPRCEGGSDARNNRVLVHLLCHQQATAAWRKGRQRADAF